MESPANPSIPKDSLVPDLNWLSVLPGRPDKKICPACSAIVDNPEIHLNWHIALGENVRATSRISR